MKAQYYIELSSNWSNDQHWFVGPFASRDEANNAYNDERATALVNPGAEYGIRRIAVHTATEARRAGMRTGQNILGGRVPQDTGDLADLAAYAFQN
jgi:hypothetical protein